uniref:Uncharacterized protein n=1 Tax=Anguilla anguilla TaxID=7936 RepID=A0A0E9WI79_ANGAN
MTAMVDEDKDVFNVSHKTFFCVRSRV